MSAPDSNNAAVAHTPLHAWHAANGGRMVPFAGYEMPVQYASGIIKEHLATRTGAGLFDVSHMGRFRVRGNRAQEFLAGVLSSNVAALSPGSAQYTFLATESGAAVDDAYLYMLAESDYLLVVNAANRSRDWNWLAEHGAHSASVVDESEASAMIALQGPHSEALLGALTAPDSLPAPHRNALAICSLMGQPTLVARTGYTGENGCFELFPEADAIGTLWQGLVASGATPVGLGARDSLRLEAGLPLYGHELGEDRDGNEIPIFANALARFGVRTPGNGDFLGATALEAQRAEFDRIRGGELASGFVPQLLTHTVQCVAVTEGRRPIRAGHTVMHEGRPVGYVTSGAVVPELSGEPHDQTDTPTHQLRPLGLALIEARFRHRRAERTLLEACDERGRCSTIELVARHLKARPKAPSNPA